MSLENDIVVSAITHWNEKFTGISSLEISRRLDISHEVVRDTLVKLVMDGVGSLTNIHSEESEEYDIFFPAKEALAEWYFRNIDPNQRLPEYRKRLHLGYSQIKHFYFGVRVLRKYLATPETYLTDDSIEGGYIRMQPTFWENAEIKDKEAVAIGNLDFGKRLSAEGNTMVSVILWDLAELSPEEQRYWRGHEIERIEFKKNDPAFDRYIAQNFDADIVESQDALHGLLECLTHINSVTQVGIGIQLFRKTSNPHLIQPVENTYKDFCDSCSELYKLLGPDGLNQKALKSILKQKFGYVNGQFKHQGSGQSLSTLQLQDRLLLEMDKSDLSQALDQLKEYRIDADHRIGRQSTTVSDFVAEFQSLCGQLLQALRMFGKELEQLYK